MTSAMISSSRLATSAGSTPGRTSALTTNMPTCAKLSLLAETRTASFSLRTSALSRRLLARPPSTPAVTSSDTASGLLRPGTAHMR
ncbi:hypothetical protein D9M73_129220 [compost metagenome]